MKELVAGSYLYATNTAIRTLDGLLGGIRSSFSRFHTVEGWNSGS